MQTKITFVWLFVALMVLSCADSDEHPDCEGGIRAAIVGQDFTKWICGGHFILVDERQDTMRVRNGEIFRLFFEDINQPLAQPTYPIYVTITVAELSEEDPCKDYLLYASCIHLVTDEPKQ